MVARQRTEALGPSISISTMVKSVSSKLAIMLCIRFLMPALPLDEDRHWACLIGTGHLEHGIGGEQLGDDLEVAAHPRCVQFLQ
jgi:hypothetical protein